MDDLEVPLFQETLISLCPRNPLKSMKYHKIMFHLRINHPINHHEPRLSQGWQKRRLLPLNLNGSRAAFDAQAGHRAATPGFPGAKLLRYDEWISGGNPQDFVWLVTGVITH